MPVPKEGGLCVIEPEEVSNVRSASWDRLSTGSHANEDYLDKGVSEHDDLFCSAHRVVAAISSEYP
ncbi:MAG: hypothetical protein V3U24_10600 [Candidatus Neomarinimicrobiota bacterium]